MAGVTGTNWTETQRKPWAAQFLTPDRLVPGGARLDPTQFRVEDSVLVTVSGAGAAQGATAIPLASALTGPIPAGTILRFGADEYALLTSAAAAGATSLAVEALPAALEAADSTYYGGSGTRKKVVQSGTLLGRTYAERDAGTGYGPWATNDDEVRLVAFDNEDVDRNPDVDLVLPGTLLVRENFLPGWATWPSDRRAALRANYTTTVGVA